MAFDLGNTNDPGLMAFISQLVEDSSLSPAEDEVARAALDQGIDALSTEDRGRLESSVIEPYLGDCEACGTTPAWEQVLMVYDTGLCATCFDKLEGADTLGVRPEWMPLVTTPDEDEDAPEPVPAPL
ncbi:MAG: hypothetical protein QNJ73_08480 [Gammaproteobacteria bacterium]|nr:hypothetical protein [Gammaproteobacteria bacterium]